MRARIVTWNLWWRFGGRWRDRQPLIVDTLRALDPDLVALQEVWGADDTTQAHEIGAALGLHAAFAAPSLPPTPDPVECSDQVGIRLGVAVLTRWPIVGVEAPALPSVHRRPQPVVLVAEVAHPDGPLRVMTTCLEWEPTAFQDRCSQAAAVAAIAADRRRDGALPVVVAADFNATCDSEVLRPFEHGFVDAWTLGGGDPTAATLSSTHPDAPTELGELIDRRIDHVFLRAGHPAQGIGVDAVALAGDTPVDGLHPSDHRAVLCDVRWT